MTSNQSPNHRDKRAQIIEAARAVLARDGVAGCTARAVADAGPLTKSAIHYYFDDIDELVDAAVVAHVDAMLAGLRAVAAGKRDPRARLWAVLAAYLDTFAELPNAAFLWFEHWIAAGRRESTAGTADTLSRVEVLLCELITDAGGNRERAPALLSWLLGTVVQQHVRPRSVRRLRAEAEALVLPAG